MTVLGAACFHGRLPARELYRISMPESMRVATEVSYTPDRSANAAIAIAPYQAPGIYGGRGIVFRVDDASYGVYPNREWAMPLATMLGLLTQDVMTAHPPTSGGAVYDPSSYASSTYVWRGIVREFDEVDRGSAVFASVWIEARLVRTADDSMVWSGSVRLERQVPDATMPGIVRTLSGLAAEGIAELADRARPVLTPAVATPGQR